VNNTDKCVVYFVRKVNKSKSFIVFMKGVQDEEVASVISYMNMLR